MRILPKLCTFCTRALKINGFRVYKPCTKCTKSGKKGVKTVIDPVHRAMLTDFYRLFERFETLVDVNDTERWDAIGNDCRELDAKYRDPVFRHTLMGYLGGMEERARQERRKKEASV